MSTTSSTHDETFYYAGNMVTFLVEDHIFRLPQYPFLHGSEVFRDMFDVPSGKYGTEGCDDSKPIRLEGVSAAEFRALLKVLCPPDSLSLLKLSDDIKEWKAVLRLSSMWMFNTIRTQALNQLTILLIGDNHAIDNVILGRCFKISSWLLRGYNALVRLHTCPTDDEAATIGLTATVKLFRLRERYQLYPRNPVVCPQHINLTQYDHSAGNLRCSCGMLTFSGIALRQGSNTVNVHNLDTTIVNTFHDEFTDIDPDKYPASPSVVSS